MRLKTKLFITIGFFILFCIVMLYVVPFYLVENDLLKSAKEIHELVVVEDVEQIEDKLFTIFERLEGELANRILWQNFFIGFVFLCVILICIWWIRNKLIKPIEQFADSAALIAEGKYEAIELPDRKKCYYEIALLVTAFERMVSGIKDREMLRGVLDKVVSKEIATEILKEQLHLGGEDRVVTMLFSDVRDFTKLTENLPPQKTIEILNLYMTAMSQVIEGEGGIIDKYVGDEIMAIYGAPVYHPNHALRALSTGMLMIETLKQFNQERKKRGEPVFEMGIGIHTGLVVVGNMGTEERLNYTVLGRNVNLAARLCQAAGPGQLIISEFTLKEPEVRDSFMVKELEPISLKGFADPVKVFEIIGFQWNQE